MPRAEVGFLILYELGQILRRRVWQPLRRRAEVFHILPVTAATLVFLLFAYDGQLREIYISYLEGLHDAELEQGASAAANWTMNVVGFVAAVAGLALVSAILSEAHFWLSTIRVNVIYSNLSNPEAGSVLRRLRRSAAVGLALAPWLGVATGLFYAKEYVSEVYPQLRAAGIGPDQITAMQQVLPKPGALSIIIATLFLALVVGLIVDRYLSRGVARNAVFAIIPFVAIGLFVLLTDVQPARLGAVGKVDAGLMVLVASAAYYAVYYRLYTRRRGFIYRHSLSPDTGVNLQRRRRVVLSVWAAFPWLAIAFYFAIVLLAGETDSSRSAPEVRLPTGQYLLPPSRWAIFSVTEAWVLVIGLIVGSALDSFRESRALQRTIIVSVSLLMIVALTLSWLGADLVVQLYRLLGPIGSVSLELVFVFSIFALLAVLSQRSGFPALTLVLLAVVVSALFPISINVTVTALTVVCTIFVVMAVFSRLWSVAVIAALLVVPGITAWIERTRFDVILQNSEPAGPVLKQSFEEWLRLRPDAAAYAGRSRYPVFIVAVEGGGIYAAAAASLFLAGLEDANPGFAQHVFAISGVSGGAIGAAVFQAFDSSMVGRPGARSGQADIADGASVSAETLLNGCEQRDRLGSGPLARHLLSPMVAKVMRDDHFSPVVGAMFPDFLGAFAVGRPEVLAASFRKSVNSNDSQAARELGKCFGGHWSTSSGAPALILNTTWAETGFRVAFSPFQLHGDDDSLYSFLDRNMPDVRKTTLMEAAIVSARFPGILPPFSVAMRGKDGALRWNFVDGGYSDSTGSGTALALYRALKPEAEANHAEIKIILVTSSDPQPDLNPNRVSISGTEFRDTLAPIAAVMKVREGLGNQAVARVCEEFHMNRNCGRQSNRPNSPLKMVGINDEFYGLPLGWKLSRTTFEVVRQSLGDPLRCAAEEGFEDVTDDVASQHDAAELTRQTFQSNSCILKLIADLLDAKRPDRQ